MRNIKIILIATAVSVVAFSCSDAKKIARGEKLAKEFPQICSTLYPIDTVFLPGTEYTTTQYDTIPGIDIVVPCPPNQPDTVKVKISCPPCVSRRDTVWRHDTAIVESSSVREEWKKKVEARDKTIADLSAEVGPMRKSRNIWMWIAIGLGIIHVARIAVGIKKFVTPTIKVQ